MNEICTLKNSPNPHIHASATEFPHNKAFSHLKFISPTNRLSNRSASRIYPLGELDVLPYLAHASAMKSAILRVRSGSPILLLLTTALLSAGPITTARLSCEVENTPSFTNLTVREKDGEPSATLRIEWVSDHDEPAQFKSAPSGENSITSTHRFGRTTVTRTIVASEAADCILLHVRADQPGPVHFIARFINEAPVEIHARRQLILTGEGIHAHAWIIPFESDVRDDGKSAIVLAGEGEALIILNATTDPRKRPVCDTLTRLGEKHDPGHTPPSPHHIWQALKP